MSFKRIILLSFFVCGATSAIAEPYETNKGKFYFKAFGGLQKLNNIKNAGNSFKFKSNIFAGIGVGYNISDIVRVDITAEHFFYPAIKARTIQNTNTGVTESVKGKLNLQAYLLNCHVDVWKAETFSLFAGIGAGVSSIKLSGNPQITGRVINPGVASPSSSKRMQRLAYALTFGTAIELSTGVNAEVAYHWRDFGKPTGLSRIKGHNASVGIRFDV